MKIAIDCSKAINEKAGIARYTWEIAYNLPRIFKDDNFFYYFNFIRGYKEKNKLIKEIINDNENIKHKIYYLPGGLKEKLYPSSIPILNKTLLDNADVYLATEFLSYKYGLKIPQVLTVHDLALLRFPKHRGEKESLRHAKILKLACVNSDHIIAISQSTKNDIIQYFGINEKKITVVYNGYSDRFGPLQLKDRKNIVHEKYKINKPFILFVGTVEPRKNIVNLMKAYAEFNKKNDKFDLVIVGKRGWNTYEIDSFYDRISCKDKIHFLNFVPDEDLVYFYNNADLFCYPSVFEGFGLPVLEAMACGAAVVTSKVSSIPEVCGDAAYYIDPNDYLSIRKSFEDILGNIDIKKEMKLKSLKQAKKFSWEKCVSETHNVLKKASNKYEK